MSGDAIRKFPARLFIFILMLFLRGNISQHNAVVMPPGSYPGASEAFALPA
jgi:hypothetical protein